MAALTPPGQASAHGVLPLGAQVFVEDGALVGGMASYGLLWLDADGVARWTPDDVLPELPLWSHYPGADRVLAGTRAGVFVTQDGGCSWSPIPAPLTGRRVLTLGRDALNPARLFAPTADADARNAVFISDDGGVTWTQSGLEIPDGRVDEVVVAPGGLRAWARTTAAANGHQTLWQTSDGGVRWTPSDVSLDPFFQPDLLGTDAAGHLLLAELADVEEIALRRVEDDGTRTTLDVFPGQLISAVAEVAGQTLVSVNRSRLYRAPSPDAPFTLVEDAPAQCLDGLSQPGVAWSCGQLGDDHHFLVTADGLTWQGFVAYDEVCPATCDAPETTALIDEFWPVVQQTGVRCSADAAPIADDGPSPDAAPDAADPDPPAEDSDTTLEHDDPHDPEDGCGCRHVSTPPRTPRGAGALALLALALVTLRRALQRRRA